MGRLAILKPVAAVIAGTFPGATRLAFPDPKEAAVMTAAGTFTIDVDLGAIQSVDTVFLGYVSAAVAFSLSYGTAAYTTTAAPAGSLTTADFPAETDDGTLHATYFAAAPFSARFIRITVTGAVGLSIGVFAAGLNFAPFWGHEWGSGRPIEDTGTADRLLGGGFGINEGARVSGYQWTFGDLTDAELKTLFRIVKDRGSTRSALIVEDNDRSAGIHERVHWGLLDRLEAYERQGPGLTRWNLKIRDWG